MTIYTQELVFRGIVEEISGGELKSKFIREDNINSTVELLVVKEFYTHNRVMYWGTHKIEELGESLYREVVIKAIFGI